MASTLPTENPIEAPSRAGDRSGVTPAASGEVEKAFLSIRQARDALISRNLELSSKLAVAADRISELEDEREAAEQSRDAALQLVQEISKQGDDLREFLQVLTEENVRLQTAHRELGQPAIAEQTEAVSPGRENAVEIEELRRKLADIEAASASNNAKQEMHTATLSSEVAAAQRAREIAVGAVTNAQGQIERLASECRDLRAQVAADQQTFKARILQLESQIEARNPGASRPASDSASDANMVDPFACVASSDASAEAETIRACIESLAADPENRAKLEELDERFRGYAASAGGIGHGGIARLSSACGELTRWLRKTPRKLTAMVPALRDAAKLLADLSADSHPERIDDPAGTLVYSVDDDGDNCECIAMSLDKMALRTRYAMKPEIALVELNDSACEVIILDVDLPGMDGFELSERIRATDRHRETPIIFLSGLESTKERLSSLPGGRHSFIPKPYNLNELGVIVLGMILKARLAKDVPQPILTIV